MPVVFETVTRRPVRRGARRALTLAALTVLTVPLFSAAALADGGRVGTKYNPDPLSPLGTWLIYGGTIVGGFLLALILTALSERKSSSRYRPGQPWQHDEVWLGGESETSEEAPSAEQDAPAAADSGAPGSGGASGRW
jgi:hypothetical protein